MGDTRPWRRRFRVAVLMVAIGLVAGSGIRATAIAPSPIPNCVANATMSVSNANDVTIPDESTVTSTVVVAGASGEIVDVDVLTRIAHTSPADLDITLTAPTGKIVELSIGNGAGAVNAFNGTVWDDDADSDGVAPYATNDGLVTDHNYVTGVVATPLVPQEGLAAFVGDNPNGTWTLTVSDVLPGDTGVIDEWGLTVTTGSRAARATQASGNSNVAIATLDGGTVSSQISIPAFGIASVDRLRVRTAITHGNVDDLLITLTSPAGTTVTLTSQNGGGTGGGFQLTEWSVPAGPYTGTGLPDPVTRVQFQPGIAEPALAPEESFGALIGESPSGTWTLRINDAANGVSGTLDSWSISIEARVSCSGALTVASTPGPLTARVGARVPVTVTATNTGPGLATDLFIGGRAPNLTRLVGAVPSPGGTCRGTAEIRCDWPGTTQPTAARSVTLTLEPYVVGTTTFQWSSNAVLTFPALTFPTRPLETSLQSITFLGSDIRAGNGRRCTVLGTPGPDVMRPEAGLLGAPGVYCGLAGNDRMVGSALSETLDGGTGRDVIAGGLGRDDLSGGPGADVLTGGGGPDVLRGGPGADRLIGGPGRDRVFGGPGRDTAVGAGDLLFGVERRP